MGILRIRPKEECHLDAVALGEVMLRLDPGEGRVHTARSFRAWEGGGEYNVVRGLRRCFGLRTGMVTALVDNSVGRLLEDFILQGGVDVSQIRWVPHDGVGRHARNGLNFTERGFGIRPALGVSDRGNTAASQLKVGDIDWHHLFGELGVRWFHTGGIFAALSESTRQVANEAIAAARQYGTVISYDLNYRASLWADFGGRAEAQRVNQDLVRGVDVVFGNEEDFIAALGFDVANTDASLSSLDVDDFEVMIGEVTHAFPNLRVVATSLRAVKTASVNDWSGLVWVEGDFYQSTERPDLAIFDRVGGGDSFASGLIFGLMEKGDPRLAVEYGAAHGALAMTTPGDCSMATLSEVEAVMRGSGARVQR